MPRNVAFGGASRGAARGVTSVACLAFVAALAIAFWAGALWIGNTLIQLFMHCRRLPPTLGGRTPPDLKPGRPRRT